MRGFGVEFVGLWGSGKSTLASATIDHLRSQGIQCPSTVDISRLRAVVGFQSAESDRMTRGRRMLALSRNAIAHPFIAARILFALSQHLVRSKRLCLTGSLKYVLLIRSLELSNQFDVVIWDEGVVASALVNAPHVARTSALDIVRALPLSSRTFYICLRTDLPTALARWRQRYPLGPTSTPTRIAVQRLRKWQRACELVIDYLGSSFPGRVLILDAREPSGTNVERICRFLDAHLQNN